MPSVSLPARGAKRFPQSRDHLPHAGGLSFTAILDDRDDVRDFCLAVIAYLVVGLAGAAFWGWLALQVPVIRRLKLGRRTIARKIYGLAVDVCEPSRTTTPNAFSLVKLARSATSELGA